MQQAVSPNTSSFRIGLVGQVGNPMLLINRRGAANRGRGRLSGGWTGWKAGQQARMPAPRRTDNTLHFTKRGEALPHGSFGQKVCGIGRFHLSIPSGKAWNRPACAILPPQEAVGFGGIGKFRLRSVPLQCRIREARRQRAQQHRLRQRAGIIERRRRFPVPQHRFGEFEVVVRASPCSGIA